MLNYYRQSILNLLADVHEARKSPFENTNIWRNVQEELIKKISHAENRIRSLKKEITQINKIRKTSYLKLPKAESLKEKAKIERKKSQLEEYRWLISIYKSIGDSIAFTFIHKLDIKPQNFKQSSGFITEKSGFKKEKQMFRYTFKKGGIAILNDLTSVLRYSDITVISKDGYISIEVKSSNNVNERINRQKSNAEKIYKYLDQDIIENLYDIEGITQRLPLLSPERNHLSLVNKLIEKSKKDGSAFQLAEPGVLYSISHKYPPSNKDISKVFKQFNIIKPIAYMLNAMKFTEQGYYPFSLSFFNPADYLDFLEGKFVIFIFIDTRTIIKIARQFHFSMTFSEDPNYVFEFNSKMKNPKISCFKMSKHLFLRTVMEHVSLNWLLNDTFERVDKINYLQVPVGGDKLDSSISINKIR